MEAEYNVANPYTFQIPRSTSRNPYSKVVTMVKVHKNYLVPRLRKLAKRLIKNCHGCKEFRTITLASSPPGLLSQRIEQ